MILDYIKTLNVWLWFGSLNQEYTFSNMVRISLFHCYTTGLCVRLWKFIIIAWFDCGSTEMYFNTHTWYTCVAKCIKVLAEVASSCKYWYSALCPEVCLVDLLYCSSVKLRLVSQTWGLTLCAFWIYFFLAAPAEDNFVSDSTDIWVFGIYAFPYSSCGVFDRSWWKKIVKMCVSERERGGIVSSSSYCKYLAEG